MKTCECGCGREAPLAPYTNKTRNYIKGQPLRFIHGHSRRKFGSHQGEEYPTIYLPDHPRVHINGRVCEHIIVVEKALGKPLPEHAVVHHVDGNKHNNTNSNLVICQDHRYHMFLHARQRIVRAGGNPNTDRICNRCKTVKSLTQFNRNKANHREFEATCRECRRNFLLLKLPLMKKRIFRAPSHQRDVNALR